MINVTMDGIDIEKTGPTTQYEPLAKGFYEGTVTKTREGAAIVRVSQTAQPDGSPKVSLSLFYTASGQKAKGVNFNVDILGTKSVVAKKGPNAGQTVKIDYRSNLSTFLQNYGFTKEEIATASISFTGLEDAAALESAGWKGVSTDILVNGQSIADRLTNRAVKLEVEISAKGNSYVKTISNAA